MNKLLLLILAVVFSASGALAAESQAETESWLEKINTLLTHDPETPAMLLQGAPVNPDAAEGEDASEGKSAGQSIFTMATSTLLDIRLKFGDAAELKKLRLYGTAYSGNGASSDNVQLDAVIELSRSRQSNADFIMNAGVFKRQHSGSAVISSKPTTIDYDVTGVTVGAGVGLKKNDSLHFEGKFEVGMGSGQPTFSSPGVVWNQSKNGGYRSTSLILGGYYTIPSGLQFGLELGVQSFHGNYSIMNNSGQWIDAKVSGSGTTANMLIGYRF